MKLNIVNFRLQLLLLIYLAKDPKYTLDLIYSVIKQRWNKLQVTLKCNKTLHSTKYIPIYTTILIILIILRFLEVYDFL